MKIQIARIEDDIFTTRDYGDIIDKGEIAHILCELEIIKLDLLAMWEEYEETK